MCPLTEEVGERFEGVGLGVVKGAASNAEDFDQVIGAASVEVAFGEEEIGTPTFFERVGVAIGFEGVEGALQNFPQGEAASGGSGLVAMFLPVRFDEGDLGEGQFSQAAGVVPGFEGLMDGGAGDHLLLVICRHFSERQVFGRFGAGWKRRGRRCKAILRISN